MAPGGEIHKNLPIRGCLILWRSRFFPTAKRSESHIEAVLSYSRWMRAASSTLLPRYPFRGDAPGRWEYEERILWEFASPHFEMQVGARGLARGADAG